MLISPRKRRVESERRISDAAQHNSKVSTWVDEQSSHDSFGSILPGLPDDVAMICLARVPRKHLIIMGAVCKRWRSFIQSKDFSFMRKRAGMLEEWLYFFTRTSKKRRYHWEVVNSTGVQVWEIPPMPGSVNDGFCTVVFDGKLLIIGGYFDEIGPSSATADVQQYDARLNSWSMLAKMNCIRYNFACSEVNGLIYAVGGRSTDGYDELSDSEVYDPDKNEWTLIENLPQARSKSLGCCFGSKLYVMGGVRNQTMYFCPHVDVYCPEDRSWCQLINGISDTVTSHAVLGKKLFCVLWCEIELSFFDPTDNSWTILEVPFAGIPVRYIQLGILDNKLLLFSKHDPDYQAVVYDPAAPHGLQWSRSEIRAPGPFLSTVAIEA